MEKSNKPSLQSSIQPHTLLANSAQAWREFILEIAHFLGNKMGILQIEQEGIQEDLSILESQISQKKLKRLQQFFLNFDDEINRPIRQLIQVLNGCSNMLIDESNMTILSATDCIDKLLNSYPFKDNERNVISLHFEGDFKFKGVPSLIHRILTKLLDNLLVWISKEEQDRLDIYFAKQGDFNSCHFKMNAATIPSYASNKFKQCLDVHTRTVQPDLGIYRLTLLHLGGDLLYQVKEKEYAELILLFPQME